jgi:hypothetical protein
MESVNAGRLIRFESYAEISPRPNFVPALDVAAAVPKEVIGAYYFVKLDERKCGIRNCGTQHQAGFLIAMEGGQEILVGNRCGEKKFGLAFKELVREANRRDRIARDQDEVAATIQRAPALLGQIEEILARDRGAKWLASRLADFRKFMPPESLHELSRRARRGEADIHDFRRMTKDEVEVAKATGQISNDAPGPFIHRTVVAALDGLEVWGSDLRALLIDDVQTGVRQLIALSPQQMPGTKLRKTVSWIRELSLKLERVEELIRAGQKFFDPDNLKHLTLLEVNGSPIKDMSDGLRELARAASRAGSSRSDGRLQH